MRSKLKFAKLLSLTRTIRVPTETSDKFPTTSLGPIMAPLLEDPRLRHRWNQFSQNAESATENAAANIWDFQRKYLSPCLTPASFCVEKCIGKCISNRDERTRRRVRGRAEASFDFYDDWDQDDNLRTQGLLGGWGNDDFGRLLSGNSPHTGRIEGINQQPRKKKNMIYSKRGRGKSHDHDPTVIPSTSALGFLGRLPFKFGGTLRYKPSAADLQDHPGKLSSRLKTGDESEPLIASGECDDELYIINKHRGNRRYSTSSLDTSDSFRSRRDLLLSDEEEDAVPLGDEIAIALERRYVNSDTDDSSQRRTITTKDKTQSNSKANTIIICPTPLSNSRSRSSLLGDYVDSSNLSVEEMCIVSPAIVSNPSLLDLRHEEDRIAFAEDLELEKRRHAASKLAIERGLQNDKSFDQIIIESKPDILFVTSITEQIVSKEDDNFQFQNMTHNHNIADESLSKPNELTLDASIQETSNQKFVPAKLPQFDS